MLKHTVFSSLLLVSTLATAQIQLNFDLAVGNETASRTITQNIELDENNHALVDCDGFIINFVAQKNDDGLTISSDILERINAEEAILLAQPTINAEWNVPATVTLANEENNDTLIFTITASE